MKTKMITIVCAAILSVWAISAQESYLPVFGEGITTFYYAEQSHDLHDLYGGFDCSKDEENANYYVALGSYYSAFEVSDDNAKLWGYRHYDGAKDLLMDLNLNVGDKFNDYTVEKVYWKDGRKHIEFEKRFYSSTLCVCIDEDNYADMSGYVEYPGGWDFLGFALTFVEGVGPNLFVDLYGEGDVPLWVYAQYRNGEFEYGIDGYPPRLVSEPGIYPGTWEFYLTCKKETGIKGTNFRALSLTPNPASDKVQITLPENTEKASLTISDLSGKIIETVAVNGSSFELDISRYAAATYIVNLSTDDYQYEGKIIKK